MYCDITLMERFCPDCWDRIWAEWYEYSDDGDYYDLVYEFPSDEYIISKYKGNDLVCKLEREMPTVKSKKKHWRQK